MKYSKIIGTILLCTMVLTGCGGEVKLKPTESKEEIKEEVHMTVAEKDFMK